MRLGAGFLLGFILFRVCVRLLPAKHDFLAAPLKLAHSSLALVRWGRGHCLRIFMDAAGEFQAMAAGWNARC